MAASTNPAEGAEALIAQATHETTATETTTTAAPTRTEISTAESHQKAVDQQQSMEEKAIEGNNNPSATPIAAAQDTTPVVAIATPSSADKEAAAESTKASSVAKGDLGDDVNPPDFYGEVLTNNHIPSPQTIRKVENYTLLDRHGKTKTFKSLYTGRNSARRVLVIFVRHFFCGNCQEYLRALSASITPEALLRLPISTFIAVVGCGDPALIDMYANETGCPFPIYADPTRKLYAELGMIKTLALGARPAYMSKSLFKSSLESIAQGLKQIKNGLATKSGDQRQIGGEFLFEPLDLRSPDSSPVQEHNRRLGDVRNDLHPKAEEGACRQSGSSFHDDEVEEGFVEEKKVTWCHRMKTTRDHAEIPELMEVLGLDGQGKPTIKDNKLTRKDNKRWSKALETRKGTGLGMASRMSGLSQQKIDEGK